MTIISVYDFLPAIFCPGFRYPSDLTVCTTVCFEDIAGFGLTVRPYTKTNVDGGFIF